MIAIFYEISNLTLTLARRLCEDHRPKIEERIPSLRKDLVYTTNEVYFFKLNQNAVSSSFKISFGQIIKKRSQNMDNYNKVVFK